MAWPNPGLAGRRHVLPQGSPCGDGRTAVPENRMDLIIRRPAWRSAMGRRMAREPDLFELYRWLLLIVGTVYTIVVWAQWLWRWLAYFGESRPKHVLGHYAVVLLLRTRLRRFAWDLGQVAAPAGDPGVHYLREPGMDSPVDVRYDKRYE